MGPWKGYIGCTVNGVDVMILLLLPNQEVNPCFTTGSVSLSTNFVSVRFLNICSSDQSPLESNAAIVAFHTGT